MFFHLLPDRSGLLCALTLRERRNVRRRQGGRSAQEVFQNPLAARYRGGSVGDRSHQQKTGLAQQTTAVLILDGDALEPASLDTRNPVVASQCLVHESVIGVEQIHHVAVLAKDAFEKQFGLAAKRLPQIIVKSTRLGTSVLQFAQIQPLPAEIGRQRFRAWIRQHASRLRF